MKFMYWKEELFRNAKWLVESLSKKRWIDRSFARLEKCLMLSAYPLRKLAESKKIENNTRFSKFFIVES